MTPGCAPTRAIAAELALGIAEGDQRAVALEHLTTCASCRAEVDQLAATADSLLLTAPGAEPPAGFETSVLDRLDALDALDGRGGLDGDGSVGRPPAPPTAARGRRPLRSLVLAAAVVVVLLVGIGIGRAWTADPPGTDPRLARGSLVAASGEAVGEVTAVSGERSLLVLTVAGADGSPLPAGDYRVECVYGRGYAYDAGVMRIDPTHPVSSWSRSLDFTIEDLTQVRLLGPDGTDAVADIAWG